VPLTGADLIAPKGEIELALFPGEDSAVLQVRLQGYLDQAYTQLDALTFPDTTDLDQAASAYAYYRAYKAVHLRMSASAATASIEGEASRSFLASQIATFAELRDDYEQKWDDVLALADVVVEERRAIDAPHGTSIVIPIW
jgi:C4-type Zn-finger protein